MTTETITWTGSGAGNRHSEQSDSEWSYSIFYNAQRHDYWLWFGDHAMHNLCNPFPTVEEAQAAAALHYNDEPAPDSVRVGGYKGWKRPHPRWTESSIEASPWLAREELDSAIKDLCDRTDRLIPQGYKWELHRDFYASGEVEQLLNSLRSSDRNEYMGANQHLMTLARRCLTDWNA